MYYSRRVSNGDAVTTDGTRSRPVVEGSVPDETVGSSTPGPEDVNESGDPRGTPKFLPGFELECSRITELG